MLGEKTEDQFSSRWVSLSQWLVTKLEAPRELPVLLPNKSLQDIQITKPKGNLEGKKLGFSQARRSSLDKAHHLNSIISACIKFLGQSLLS